MKSRTHQVIEKDFSTYKDKVLGILLYGSKASGTHHERSDTDICLVAGDYDGDLLFKELITSNLTAKYDVKIFETLPLKIKGSILDNHKVIYSRDKPELSYYLHKWRDIWEDQERSLRKLGLEMYS